ncbi:hypothetical protein V8C37DRAFT_373001 [Trichoderma ceciliae]
MEGALEQMAAAFLDFTNGFLESPLVGRDPALVSKLRTATDSVLNLCQGSDEVEDGFETCQMNTVEDRPLSRSADDDAGFQLMYRGNGELPQAATLDSIFLGSNLDPNLDPSAFNQPTPAPRSGNGASTVQFNPFVKLHSPQMRNVFGNGFMNLPLIDFADCAHTDAMLQTYPSEGSLSIIVTRASLQNGYDAILSDTQATTAVVDRIFGFPLKFRSREEILMVLRWYLRPQTPELIRLATAEFDDYLVAQYYHGIVTSQYSAVDGVFRGRILDQSGGGAPPPTQSRILNADIKPTGLLLNTGPPNSPETLLQSFTTLQEQIPLQHGPILDGQATTGYDTSSGTTSRSIRLSRSRLIHVLTGISFCIDKGPAYCEKALLEAIVTAMITDD